MLKHLFSATIFFYGAVFPFLAFAGEDQIGTTAGQVIKLGTGARAAAMGEVYVAVADECDGVVYNPAGLALRQAGELQAGHIEWFEGARMESLNGSVGLGSLGALGASFNYLMLPTQARTERVANGPLASQNYVQTGEFNPADLYAVLGWAYSFDPSIQCGAALKVTNQNLDDSNAMGLGADLGMICDAGLPGVKLGLAAQNLGLPVTMQNEAFYLPVMWRMGASGRYLGEKLLVSAEFDIPMDNQPAWAFGVEYGIANRVFPRFGLRLDHIFNPWSAGLGVNLFGVRMDLATVPFDELGLTYRGSLTWEFSGDTGTAAGPGAAETPANKPDNVTVTFGAAATPLPLPGAPTASMKADPALFSNQVRGAVCQIKPAVSFPERIKASILYIYDSMATPKVVRAIKQEGPTPGALAWDGNLEGGQPAPAGTYSLIWVAQYDNGQRVMTPYQRVEIQNQFAELKLEIGPNSLRPGEPGKLFLSSATSQAEFFITATQSRLPARYKLAIYSQYDTATPFKVLEGSITPGSKVQVLWGAKTGNNAAQFYSNTTYQFKLFLLDSQGNQVKEYPALGLVCVYKL